MNPEEYADPLGLVEEEFVTDPRIYRRAFWLLVGLAALLVGLGFVLHDYNIELWVFGGFALIMAVIVRVIGSRMVAGRLTLHQDGLRYVEGESEMAIRWDQIQRAQIVRIPIKMEGLVTVDYNYEIAVFGIGRSCHRTSPCVPRPGPRRAGQGAGQAVRAVRIAATPLRS